MARDALKTERAKYLADTAMTSSRCTRIVAFSTIAIQQHKLMNSVKTMVLEALCLTE